MRLSHLLISTLFLILSGCGGNESSQTDPTAPEQSNTPKAQDHSSQQSIANEITATVKRTGLMFNWDMASDSFFCDALKVSTMRAVIGAAFEPDNATYNQGSIKALSAYLNDDIDSQIEIHRYDTRLSTLYVTLNDCSELQQLRRSPLVQFIEPKFTKSMQDKGLIVDLSAADSTDETPTQNNPAFYDSSSGLTYSDYVRNYSPQDADIMSRHNISGIYDQYQHYGDTNIGVAVVDNGVLAGDIAHLSHVPGGFTAYGFYRPFGLLNEIVDGLSPRLYDFIGISQLIENIYNHGSRQLKHVFNIAPNISLVSARANSLPVMILPSQYQGVIDSILEMADNPGVRIVSLSAGSIIENNELVRAIDYFNAKDKIIVAAAGTTAKFIRNLVGVVFPATLDSVIATTGLTDTHLTGGEFVLGDESHGGPEVDFTVDHSSSSSESVSTTSGMFALIWSANPSLTREQVINVFIESSTFYLENGKPDPVFGWGKVDLLMAFEKAVSLEQHKHLPQTKQY